MKTSLGPNNWYYDLICRKTTNKVSIISFPRSSSLGVNSVGTLHQAHCLFLFTHSQLECQAQCRYFRNFCWIKNTWVSDFKSGNAILMRRMLFLHEKVLKLYIGEFTNGYSIQFPDPNEFWEVFPKLTLEITMSLDLEKNEVE